MDQSLADLCFSNCYINVILTPEEEERDIYIYIYIYILKKKKERKKKGAECAIRCLALTS
jgi:hypothetical protein